MGLPKHCLGKNPLTGLSLSRWGLVPHLRCPMLDLRPFLRRGNDDDTFVARGDSVHHPNSTPCLLPDLLTGFDVLSAYFVL